MTLGFKAPPIGDALQIVIVRPDNRTIVTQTDAKITIDGEIVRTNALSYPLGRDRAAHLVNLTGDRSAALRRASALGGEIKSGGRKNKGLRRTFSLGPMAGVWVQLDSCLARLRQNWNIPRLLEAARPIMPLEKMFSSADYPRLAVRQLLSGTTEIMLLIDETGAVKDCTLTQASGVAVLDARTCGLIIWRARFQPAIGSDGKPAKSAFTQTITWRLQ